MKFRTTIEQGGKSATGFEVPAEVVTGLGTSKKPAVLVTINGHTYRSTVATRDGRYVLPLSAENRGKAGVAGGDEVEVDLQLDTEPRTIATPPDLAEALEGDPTAKAFYEGLSYSRKQWYVLWIEGAKKAETREARVAKAVVALHEGRQRA